MGEAEDGREKSAEEAFSNLSIEYEALKSVVSRIIQKEMLSVLDKRNTSKIRSLVHREIDVAIKKVP